MKGTQTPTPHDAIFKKILGHPDTARDFLQIHLPAGLLNICSLDTLALESGNFIEEDLRAYYSDVLYSVKTTGGEGYIYTLIEHQSTPDRLMAFRLMRYAIAVMQRHLDAGNEQLPLVVPILFYHGRVTPYPYSMSWLQAFSEPQLAARLYGGDFPLVDVTVIADDEIMQHRRMAILELLQKHIRQRDLMELLEPLVTLLFAGYTGEEQLKPLFNYMLQVGRTPSPQAFAQELSRRTSGYKEGMMTLAEWFEQNGNQFFFEQGEEKGIEQGIEQGMERGLKKGRLEGAMDVTRSLARKMLAKGFERQAIADITGLSEDELAEMDH
ncbi:Rpn family recombination-promoting nuclease/putative transposase [Erwinia sp. JUb26]|uniref:Rpn family recombination-promoting nuclease/putative transposase n=1 Tax=Erwinia sp. JUb26 TaxID=2485126 RepID=UPI000F486AC1|nr:Rpn family recombination-promoting nuclease/putative transposase [Erwinia sp. JUb26]ROR13659.1 putative transposase/invertase (TIGR01784 family) [Erwinia sp. JUb26]